MKRLLTFLSAALLLLSCNRTPDGPFRVTGLQVDYMTTPLGLDTPFPRFSWKMESNHYAQRQAAYRLVVTESGTGETVWDSAADGTRPSDDTAISRKSPTRLMQTKARAHIHTILLPFVCPENKPNSHLPTEIPQKIICRRYNKKYRPI